MNRRQFLAAGSLVVSAPFVLRLGRQTMAQTLRVRRNLSTLAANDPFFTDYAEAITAMHRLPETDARSWRGQSLIHANFCPHDVSRRPDFVLWHRHYITYFERLCGALIGKPAFALPYWDWTANSGRLPAPFFANGPLNVAFWSDRSDYQSANWGPDRIESRPRRGITATRGLRDDPRLGGEFTPAAINGILRQTRYSTFQSRLEGSPHNNTHIISGGADGHMGDGLSPLDPMFWLHHCNVDRLTAQWQRAGNRIPQQNFSYDRQFVDPSGAAQTVTAAQALDFAAMGFTYDILAEPVVVGSGTPEPARPRGLTGEGDQPAATDAPAHSHSDAVDQPPPDEQNGSGTGALRIVGRGENAQPCAINRPAQIAVSTDRIVNDIIASDARSAAPGEESLVLARLTVRELSGAIQQCLVNVFVNAPDLAPDTPTEDRHYAGTFSFFGQHYVMHGGGEFLVDVSNVLRDQAGEGRLGSQSLDVQVLPVLADPDGPANAQFVVGAVELISG